MFFTFVILTLWKIYFVSNSTSCAFTCTASLELVALIPGITSTHQYTHQHPRGRLRSCQCPPGFPASRKRQRCQWKQGTRRRRLSLWAVKQECVAPGTMSVSYQPGWHIDATESDSDESKPPHSNSERTLAIDVLKQPPPSTSAADDMDSTECECH